MDAPLALSLSQHSDSPPSGVTVVSTTGSASTPNINNSAISNTGGITLAAVGNNAVGGDPNKQQGMPSFMDVHQLLAQVNQGNVQLAQGPPQQQHQPQHTPQPTSPGQQHSTTSPQQPQQQHGNVGGTPQQHPSGQVF
eukprot:PhM_4_TR9842/c0_g1_i1/m.86132